MHFSPEKLIFFGGFHFHVDAFPELIFIKRKFFNVFCDEQLQCLCKAYNIIFSCSFRFWNDLESFRCLQIQNKVVGFLCVLIKSPLLGKGCENGKQAQTKKASENACLFLRAFFIANIIQLFFCGL